LAAAGRNADVLRVGPLWVRDVRGDRFERIRDLPTGVILPEKRRRKTERWEQYPSAPWVPSAL
jgi:hypothetical protein